MTPRRALLWSFAERYSSFVVTLFSSMVLARLLTPAQVGVYSVCASVTAVAGIVRDFGVSEYLIQERELTREKLRSAYGVAFVAAWSVAALLLASRSTLAAYFGEPGVAAVLAVLALQFALLPITSPSYAVMNRKMAFRHIFVLQICCNVAQALVAVWLAWHGHGFMALAWGAVAGVVTQTLLLVWSRPRDEFALPGFAQVRTVLSFGSLYVASRGLETLARQAHEPIIAKQFDFASVGLFSRAWGMVEMFHHNVADAVVQVATPAFAAAHQRSEPLGVAFAKATALYVCVSWTFFGFVALTAQELILVLFGEQWESAAPLATILALSVLPMGLFELVPQVLSATGHVGRRLRISLWMCPIHITLVLTASFIGLHAVAAVVFFSALTTLLLSLRHLRPALGDGAWALYRPSVRSGAVAAIAVAVQWVTLEACRAVSAPALVSLAATAAVGTIAWMLAAKVLRHPVYFEAVRIQDAILSRARAGRS